MPVRSARPAWLPALLAWFALICTASAVMAGARSERPASEPNAALWLRVLDQASGQPLPARLHIVQLGGFGVSRVLISDGAGQRVELPEGRYRVWASHGPEWSVAQSERFLAAGTRQSLALVLRREAEPGRYVGCDLHVHTDGSYDSQVSVAQRLASAEAEGLGVAVVTNHNQALPALPRSGGAGRRRSAQTLLVPGVEITTWQPEFGHFNLFPSRLAPAYKHSSPEQLLAALPPRPARFVQVNHPRLQRHIGYFELAREREVEAAMRHAFDGIEVWNGYDLHRAAERDRVLADWLSLVRRGRRVVATGGSDSHDLTRSVVGYPRTYVALPADAELDGQSLAAALGEGRAFVSNGPILELEVADRGPGQTLVLPKAASLVSVRVRVDAPGWMDLQTLELWVDGERVITQSIEPLVARSKSRQRARTELHLQLPTHRLRSVLAMVRGDRPMGELFDRREVKPFAFTNPVWIVRR